MWQGQVVLNKKSIQTGRTFLVRSRAGHFGSYQGGIFCPMSQASRLLLLFPMTAEVTSAAQNWKTAGIGGRHWDSAFVSRDLCAVFWTTCEIDPRFTPYNKYVVHQHCSIFYWTFFLKFLLKLRWKQTLLYWMEGVVWDFLSFQVLYPYFVKLLTRKN